MSEQLFDIVDRVSRGQDMDESHTAIVTKILKGEHIDYSAEEVCNTIVEASLFWTGEHEEEHPALKKARTVAGYQLRLLEKKGEGEEE